MLQREVVERMTAAPGGKEYGRLTVMLALFARAEVCFDIGPGRVHAAAESLVDRRAHRAARGAAVRRRDRARFASARRARSSRCGARRSAASLKGRLTPEQIASAGIDPKARPETLAPADFARLAALEP